MSSGQILHFGVGNFFRAHLADYTQNAGGWRIIGVSLRSASIADGLKKQNNTYTLCVQGTEHKRIDILQQVLVAPQNPGAVLAYVVDPRVKIISLTVTEKAYCLGPDNRLDLAHPLIQADLSGQEPQTAVGFLTRGLANRRAPLTVLCCDNLSANGDVLGAAVRDFAARAGLSINWDLVEFPNSMVDRITPATSDELRFSTGDPMAVPTEPFCEWVIEDRFADVRPNWPGVQFVPDVAPYEMRKLRMLNGAHSYLAYAGLAAGYDYVHQAVADEGLRRSAAQLMDEAAQTLSGDLRTGSKAYGLALLARFENPHLHHQLRQIAMDGSQKIPYRWGDSLRALAQQGVSAPALSQAVTAWIGFCCAEVAAGRALQDPADHAIASAAQGPAPKRDLLALVGIDPALLS